MFTKGCTNSLPIQRRVPAVAEGQTFKVLSLDGGGIRGI
jgi:hypothetical protein